MYAPIGFLVEALGSSDAKVRLQAAHAVGAVGSDAKDAIPYVVAAQPGIKTYLDSLTEEAPYVGVAKSYAFDPSTHELAATDREALIFFYTTEPGSISLEGSAAEVLGG